MQCSPDKTERRSAVRPRPGVPLGQLSDTLAVATDFRAFVAAVEAEAGVDLRFIHAPRCVRQLTSGLLQSGVNCFGSQEAHSLGQFRSGEYRMHEVETVILHEAIFSPRSTTIVAINRGFYGPSIHNFCLTSRTLKPLVAIDPLYVLDDAGACSFSSEVTRLDYFDSVAIPICGTGFHNYGHFLYDGLPVAHALMAALRDGAAEIVGPPLRSWQRSILDVLGLLGRYRPMHGPAVFRKIVSSNLVSLHVSYPTRFVRTIFDTIRFRIGGPDVAQTRKVFVSRRNDTTRRLLVNRAEVEACFSNAGFEIVVPEDLSFAEQVRLFSACAVVAGESGAGMANVAFCDPGTKVLEIQPAAFSEGWTRTACMIFALEWNVYFARSHAFADSENTSVLTFAVDPDEIRTAIRTVTRT